MVYTNVNVLRLGVLDRVVQRLLDETEQLPLGALAEGQAFPRGINVDLLSVLAGGGGSVLAHGLGEAALVQRVRPDLEDQGPYLAECVLGEAAHLSEAAHHRAL